MEAMSAVAVNPAYAALLAKVPPRVIKTEAENESFIEALYALDKRQSRWTKAERDLAELLTLLIEDFEEKQYALPKCSAVEMVAFLMEQQGLKQKDLVDVFGAASIVSEVMSGKRELNKEHIRRLSERFQVSPELFF
jgi:HTH-type transcriptional regulator / antitoxin HigA